MENLPPPDVIAQEIVEDLEAALAEFSASLAVSRRRPTTGFGSGPTASRAGIGTSRATRVRASLVPSSSGRHGRRRQMRFTHHARNRMRHYGISLAEIRVVLADPIDTRQDGRGNQKVTGAVGGRSVVVVLAADDSGLIITLYTKRRA